MQYVAFDPHVEVDGAAVLAIVDGVGAWSDSARRILAENGIADPQPGQWYPQQSWLNAFAAIARIGDRTLAAIGRHIPDSAQWPPEIESIQDALASIDVAYHMNHRKDGQPLFDPVSGIMGSGIGHYKLVSSTERSAEMVCSTPYPCPVDTGIVTAVAQSFAPVGAKVTVEHRPGCRAEGDESCALSLCW